MIRRPVSLRLRLLLGTLLWILATISVTGWLLRELFDEHLSRQFDMELATHLDQLSAHLDVTPTGSIQLLRPLSDPRLERPYSGLYWQIDRLGSDARGGETALLRSRSLWDGVLDVPDDRPVDGEIHSHSMTGPNGEGLHVLERILRPSDHPGLSLRLIIAADERWLAEPLERFQQPLAIALFLLAGGLILAAIVQVMAGLRPLDQLRRDLARLQEGEQSQLQDIHPAEIQPLVDELNRLLKRNADFVERARSQAGNLAHAVKTPLTVMANAARDESGELATLVRTQVALAQQQIDHHLAKARVAAAAQLRGQHCDVEATAAGLLRLMERVHAGRALDLQLTLKESPLIFGGEAQDLQELLGNLLDNACKWARHRVVLSASRVHGRLCIDVDDDGPGIDEADRALLLQRGQRADERIPGSGLGLSIVNELANIYDGALELHRAPLGGLRARLWLPAGRPPSGNTPQ